MSEDLYFSGKTKKFKKKLKFGKPTFKLDPGIELEPEPVEKVEDAQNQGIDQSDVEGIIKQIKEKWEIKDTLEDYTNVRRLGAGATGEVWKVKHNGDGNIFARKQIIFDTSEMKPRAIGSELLGLWQSKHNRIVRLESFFYKEGHIHMLLEYMNCGDIEKVLKTVKVFPERAIAQCMKQVLGGLVHLHEQLGIVHRDIKPGNILINDKGHCKIADFGMAGMKKQIFTTFVGTMVYMSPERIRGGVHGFNSDNWSIGLTAAEMAVGKYPFEINNNTNLFDMLGIIEKIVDGRKLLPEGEFTEEFVDFVDKCMKIDKDKRWSASQLLEHEFIKKHENARPSFRSWLHKNYIKVKKEKSKKKKKEKKN